jgi:hypothetical protein
VTNERVTDAAVDDHDLEGMYVSPFLLVSLFLIVLLLWRVQRRFRLRGVALTLAGLVLVGLAAWLLPPLATPADRSVGWELSHGFGGPAFDTTTAQTTTSIPMVVDWPMCKGGDWLAPPAIVYTPWSVTITMSARDIKFPKGQVGWCLSGEHVDVRLSEPLGGRQLFDGSRFPAHPRSAGDYPWSFSQ